MRVVLRDRVTAMPNKDSGRQQPVTWYLVVLDLQLFYCWRLCLSSSSESAVDHGLKIPGGRRSGLKVVRGHQSSTALLLLLPFATSYCIGKGLLQERPAFIIMALVSTADGDGRTNDCGQPLQGWAEGCNFAAILCIIRFYFVSSSLHRTHASMKPIVASATFSM